MCQAARQQKLPTSTIYIQPFGAKGVLPQAASDLKEARTTPWQSMTYHLPLVGHHFTCRITDIFMGIFLNLLSLMEDNKVA